MRFSTGAVFLAATGTAVAQYGYSTSTAISPAATDASSGCVHALTDIVNECLKTETPKVEACSANDWTCMCEAQEQVITCFNNCPSDSRAFGNQQQKTQWCAAAKSYGQTSSTVHYSKPTKAPVSSNHGAGHRNTKAGSSNSPSSDSSGDDSGHGGNGAFAMAAPIGGAFAALLGVVALL